MRISESEFQPLKEQVIQKLLEVHEKEYYCHVQFVAEIGRVLAKTHNVDENLIEIACLLHDLGRDFEIGEEDHGDAGKRMAEKLLEESILPEDVQEVVLRCIKNHCKELTEYTIEEKIVISADCAQKVQYHEAFILLCKKKTYKEKLIWGRKYLEKGYTKTLLPEYKETITSKYNELKSIYAKIDSSINVKV